MPSGQLVPYQPRTMYPLSRGARIGGKLAMAAEAAHYANQYAQFMHHHVLSKMGGKSRVVGLKQTKATTRAGKRKTGGRNVGARRVAHVLESVRIQHPHRHETLPNRSRARPRKVQY